MYSAACIRAAMLIFPRFGVILAAFVRARSPFFCRTLPRQHTCRRGRTHGSRAHPRTHTHTRRERARARTTGAQARMKGGKAGEIRNRDVFGRAAPRHAASGNSATRRLPSAA